MEKISSTKVAAILSTVPSMLRSVAKERDDLLEKVASLQARVDTFEQQARIEKVAKAASDRNIDAWGDTHEEKVASIQSAVDGGKDLNVLEQAVELSSPDGNIAELDEKVVQASGETQLESFLLGGIG